MNFLPLSKKEAQGKGWHEIDIVLITGDAYVDHPSFGTAMIGRVLEKAGYRIGIINYPDWKNPQSVAILGKPRLFFGVTSGNVDSMLANFTAFKMRRSDDPYVPGGKAGLKPNRALIVYCNSIKQAYKDVPIVIGGIEASMRRIVHYDFWSDKLRRSILEDTRADILVYGMGEKPIVEVAKRIEQKMDLGGINGTVVMSKNIPENAVVLPAEEEAFQSKQKFIELYRLFYKNQHNVMCQPTGGRYLIHYPPAPLSQQELDAIYELPFTRQPHPSYQETIPAFEMIRDSITAHRGCVSGCSFCSLTLHQGKNIVSRSEESVLNEVKKLSREPDFKGHIKDIGGPSANNYQFECRINWQCNRESCTFPKLCSNLKINTAAWINLLEKAARIPGVKKVTVGSGIRYDLFMADKNAKQLLEKLVKNHISGQLKIAPEHSSEKVLRSMRKNELTSLQEFVNEYNRINGKLKKRQHLLPYMMSCHPGSTNAEMKKMRRLIQSLFKMIPKQVQAFIPLPMTLSSITYYTGVDPLTGEKYFVEKSAKGRRLQHRIFFKK